MVVLNLTSKDIANFIATGESETIEFKESFSEEALETVGSFSNARGGIILIGVKDSGEILGLQVGKKTVEDIANRIQTVIEPKIQPSVNVVNCNGKSILTIQVNQNIGAPVSVRGRFYKRSGRTNQRMSHTEIVHSLMINSGSSWDAQTESGATIKDLDPALIDRFIIVANKLGRRPVPEGGEREELLYKLDLIKEGIPTRAALLLFGKKPEFFFPTAFLKLGRFRSPTIIVDDREINGSLITQLDEVMIWFRDRLTTEFVISGKPEREVRWEYPLSAIREAVVNLLCHRDYSKGAHSQIRLYDDHLELWNAGALPIPLTPDILYKTHDSIPRNRKIADVFFYMGYIERWGSGTLRIVEELSRARLPKPIFTSDSGQFKVIFNKDLHAKEQLEKIGLSARQHSAIVYLKKHGSITNTEYQKLTGVSKRTATRDLNEMLSAGMVVAEGGSRGRGKVYLLAGT